MQRFGLTGFALICAAAFVAVGGAADEPTKDKARAGKTLVGTWKLVSGNYGGKDAKFPEGTTMLKHVTPTQFMWATYDKDGKVFRAAGGSYTLKGETYEETPEYGFSDDFSDIKGKTHAFKAKVEGNKWSNDGMLANGLTIKEVWERRSPQVALPQPPMVPVSQPVQRLVIDYADFTGRTVAVNTVNIVPRVTGYLVNMPFKEGSVVKKGDLLFEIDPRPYLARLEAAKAKQELAKVGLKLAQVTNVRFKEFAKKESSAVSQQDLDKYQAQEDEAVANLDLSKANLNSAKLILDWTKVTSPIDGRISRYYLTVGNLVNQDKTLLTTVVSLDPMYAYFDMDERTLVQIRQAIGGGKIKPQQGTIPVFMALQGEQGFPHEGTINFINNQVNPDAGSITIRGVFPNPVLKEGVQLFSPGMFVPIRLPIGQPHQGLLVIDRAIASDQGLKYVYVIDAQNKAQYRRVTTGQLQPDGLRTITDGLKPGEWVALGALQQIRPNMQVQTEKVTMPSIGPSAEAKK